METSFTATPMEGGEEGGVSKKRECDYVYGEEGKEGLDYIPIRGGARGGVSIRYTPT